MFSVREVPWHKLGVVLDAPPTAAEAIKAAGLDWKVQKRDLFWPRIHNIAEGGTMEGKFEQVPGRVALVRDEDQKFLSVVSNDYEVVQNTDAFGFFDSLVHEGKATYETAGCMCEGRKVWIMARLNKTITLPGEDVTRCYLLLHNGHDGETSVIIQPTPVRVVCNNTLRMSLQHGQLHKFSHVNGVLGRMESVKRLYDLACDEFDGASAAYTRMLEMKLEGAKGVEGLVNSIVSNGTLDTLEPVNPQEFIDSLTNTQQMMRGEILRLHEEGRGVSSLTRGTVWGVYNAAVEFADYQMGNRSKDLVRYQLHGAGAEFKDHAFEVAKVAAGLV
jgi:phage/plasmid-like protein (TIGR03299 family)